MVQMCGDEDGLFCVSLAQLACKHGAFHSVQKLKNCQIHGIEKVDVDKIYRNCYLECEHSILSGCFNIQAFYLSELKAYF